MNRPGLLLLFVLLQSLAFCQGLQNVPPVLIGSFHNKINTGASFLLTPNSKLQIADANQPWPPRWFVGFDMPKSSSRELKDYKPYVFADYARVQNNFGTFYKRWPIENDTDTMPKTAYIILNKKMEVVDSFNTDGMDFNFHDFRINEKGEKLICFRLDTLLNLSNLTANPEDTAVKTMIDIIEILDHTNKIIFRWNPVMALGINSLYYPYGLLPTQTSKAGYVDWSHANAFSWDFDGNILYCFRHIGIGKISAKDGHIIWRLDRNKMPYIFGTDTVAFYLQHAFEKVSDNPHYTTYSLYANGDSLHPYSFGMEFTVNKRDNAVHIVNKKSPDKLISSWSGGNYEVHENGDYVLNYGTFTTKDTANKNVFFEYGNERTKSHAEYKLVKKGKSYEVQELNGWRPPRPVIVDHGNQLKAAGEMKEWTWYQLSGTDNTQVKKVGEGANFSPTTEGNYCVAGKYGIGYSVSLPFYYKIK